MRGRVEAVAAGQLLRSRGINAKRVCVAYTSELERSHETCELVLASMAGHEQDSWSTDRIRRDWRLNERHYGSVQGLYKKDPSLAERFGVEELTRWRRSLHGKPPPIDPSNKYYLPPPAPLTESLADCQRRVVGCWEDNISRALFDEEAPIRPADRMTLVVAHANTIRALMAHFDEVPEEMVPRLHVPNSVPILYHFDLETRRPVAERLQSAHGGSHARWMLSAENHHHIRDAISTGGTLTRALFDAIDTNRDGVLSRAEVERGVREFMEADSGPPVDCIVVGMAKSIALEMSDGCSITFDEFERRTQEAYEKIRIQEYNEERDAAMEWI